MSKYKTMSADEFMSGGSIKTIKTAVAPTQEPQEEKTLMEQGADFSSGFVKSGLNTAINTASMLQGAGQRVIAGVDPTRNLQEVKEQTGFKSLDKTTKEGQLVQQALEVDEGAEKVGSVVSEITQFLVPSSKLAKFEKGKSLAVRSLTEGTAMGGVSAVQEGGVTDDTKTVALISAAFPIMGAVAKAGTGKLLQGAGTGAKKAGQKIQETVIKPSSRDVKDGFKVENLNKFGIGGSLKDMFSKTEQLLNANGKKINDISKNIDEGVNLNNVVEKVKSQFTGDNFKTFAENPGIERVLGQLDDNVKVVAGDNGLSSYWQAVQAKRSAGQKGSWVFGSADPDANAVEKVYTAFYRELRGELERIAKKTGNQELITATKDVSELIPVSNAMIRRIPIAERNSMISLTDTIGLVGSAFDPRALALVGVNRLSKSGNVANWLIKAGEQAKGKGKAIAEATPDSSLGQRVFGGNSDEIQKGAGLSVQSTAGKAKRLITFIDKKGRQQKLQLTVAEAKDYLAQLDKQGINYKVSNIGKDVPHATTQ